MTADAYREESLQWLKAGFALGLAVSVVLIVCLVALTVSHLWGQR